MPFFFIFVVILNLAAGRSHSHPVVQPVPAGNGLLWVWEMESFGGDPISQSGFMFEIQEEYIVYNNALLFNVTELVGFEEVTYLISTIEINQVCSNRSREDCARWVEQPQAGQYHVDMEIQRIETVDIRKLTVVAHLQGDEHREEKTRPLRRPPPRHSRNPNSNPNSRQNYRDREEEYEIDPLTFLIFSAFCVSLCLCCFRCCSTEEPVADSNNQTNYPPPGAIQIDRQIHTETQTEASPSPMLLFPQDPMVLSQQFPYFYYPMIQPANNNAQITVQN